ncbi:coiled-coil-helix-coiled-coil-helix domain-containing protein 7-like [Tropilaelaps mercedesae]|uniref:Coiled-coil-helix-coiled-coil-helix domain-containing protein 7 n=1 Tax=Tropilaelaps mercedesae TaxID=418985 RepID=A0A1V9X389_9ACAR|nr:coiled-coil-helix-coiled-coil-helix domain-containing protein 7-like [Tropilaelaps mercedesae]
MPSSKQQLDPNKKNPCFHEHNQSLRCLDQNGYDKDKCENHFANYKFCKDFWVSLAKPIRVTLLTGALLPGQETRGIYGILTLYVSTRLRWGTVRCHSTAKVVKDRKRRGIEPALPAVEDRKAVKQEYLKEHRTR